KRLYILWQMEPDGLVYNMPQFIVLEGGQESEPDTGKLEDAFKQLIQRHESLRTSFHMIDDQPVQIIHDHVEFRVCRGVPPWSPLHGDHSDISNNSGSHGGQPLQVRDFVRSFDLSQAPLLRAGIGKMDGNKSLLMIDMHHIISDGVSHKILMEDFISFYSGERFEPLSLQYKDFSYWQTGDARQDNLRSQENYWLKQFEIEAPPLNLPVSGTRPSVRSFEGTNIEFRLSPRESQQLKTLALNENVTLFMLLLALFNVLVSRLGSEEDIVIGSPIAGRRHADVQQLIGMFVNTLPLRNFPSGNKSFRSFLADVKQNTLKALENQDYQLEELVDRLALESKINRDTSRNPLFDVMFVFQNLEVFHGGVETIEIKKAGLTFTPYPLESNISKFDMTLAAMEEGDSLWFSMEYGTRLFDRETIQRVIDYFKCIIPMILEDPARKLSGIEIITPQEKQRILEEFNNTRREYPRDKTIHQLFQQQAEAGPDRVAIVGPHETGAKDAVQVTYRQLNQQSNQLASLLKEKGVAHETNPIVGITLDRCIQMVVGLLGILKAGGAYLPLNPDHPEERINYMLQDSGANILLVEITNHKSQITNKSQIINSKLQ
ncbi:MAG: AMP-binding protein, partial [bacterium]|nr:AMP-binding protein [bacterium]